MPITDAEKAAALAAAPPPPPEPELEPADPADDWSELVDFYDDTLKLKFRGVQYAIPAPDVELGLLCQQIWAVGIDALSGRTVGRRAVKVQGTVDAVLDDDSEEALHLRLLGGDTEHPSYDPARDVWQQLKDNGAPWPIVKHMGTTVFLWCAESREAALDFWQHGGARPKAPEPAPTPPPREPQDHLATTRPAAATTTPRRASMSGTKKATAPKGTRGRKSGGTGA